MTAPLDTEEVIEAIRTTIAGLRADDGRLVAIYMDGTVIAQAGNEADLYKVFDAWALGRSQTTGKSVADLEDETFFGDLTGQSHEYVHYPYSRLLWPLDPETCPHARLWWASGEENVAITINDFDVRCRDCGHKGRLESRT